MSNQPNATLSNAAAQIDPKGKVYTFRSMKELETLIEESEMRVQHAQERVQNDFSRVKLSIRQALTIGRIARGIGVVRFAKAAFNAIFKRRW